MLNNYFIYGAFSLIANGIGFVSAPLLSHYLTKNDFGIVGIFSVAMQLFVPIVGLSMNTIISRSFYTRKDISSMLCSAIGFVFGMSVVVTLLVALLPHNFIALTGMSRGLIFTAILGSFFMINAATFSALMQMGEKPFKWGIGMLAGSIMTLIVTFSLIILFDWGYIARITGLVAGQAVSAGVPLYFVRKDLILQMRLWKEHLIYFVRLGTPLIFFALSGWGLIAVDRICIQSLMGTEATGLYVFAVTLASPVLIFQTTYTRVWGPRAYKGLANGDHRKLARDGLFSFAAYVGIGFLVATIGVLIYRHIIGREFLESLGLVPWLISGIVAQGIQGLVLPFLMHKEKTKFLACVSIVSLGLCIGMNYYFIPIWGMRGAAVANFISQLFISITYIAYVRCSTFTGLKEHD